MPASALATAEHAFALLVCEPAPLAVDARPIPGLPDRLLPLDELRDLLLATTTAAGTSDAVWRHLAAQARTAGPAWVVGAVGVAVPGLTRIAARLSHGFAGQADDIESEILAGFLHALRSADLDAPRVWVRLCWAAWRCGYAARRVEETAQLPTEVPTGSRTPRLPYGHPDLVLGRAVTAGVITAGQAELIGATRLGGVLIEQVAAAQNVSAPVIRMRRRRAELALTAAIRRGDLANPSPRRHSNRGPAVSGGQVLSGR